MEKLIVLIFFCLTIYDMGYTQDVEMPQDSIHSGEQAKNNINSDRKTFIDARTEELPEVLVYKNKQINAVALGIVPHEISKLSLNQKRLHTAGDFKPIHLLSLLGGSMPLDPLINAISGRTKKLKKIIAIEQKALDVQFLKAYYSEYILKTFNIAETDFGRFLYFIADDPACHDLIESKDKEKLEFFICAQWIGFSSQ